MKKPVPDTPREIRQRIVETLMVSAAVLKRNPANFRTHPADQRRDVVRMLEEIGQVAALMAVEQPDGQLLLLDGHLRSDIADDRSVRVDVVDLSEDESRLVLALYDHTGAMAGVNIAKLQTLIASVMVDRPLWKDTLSTAAAAMQAQARAAASRIKAVVVQDDVPPPPVVPVTKAGDIWLLGDHRLMCGDSSIATDVGRLMAGAKASIVFTDPPYGVSIGAKNRLLNSVEPSGRNSTDIVDDDLSPEELEATLLPVFVNVRTIVMGDECAVFVCSPQGGELSMMMIMMQKAGLKPRHVLIWKKNQPTFSMGRLDYDYQHEPILFTWLKKHKRPMCGMHKTSVWEIDKPRQSAEHPTMKPVELYANAFLNNSEAGDVVYDPYSGSGTAIVAAEQLSRRACSMEISPVYCDVAISRWEQQTGKKAKRE